MAIILATKNKQSKQVYSKKADKEEGKNGRKPILTIQRESMQAKSKKASK